MMMLEENETLLHTARKHWLIFAVEILFAVVCAVAPLLFFLMPEGFRQEISQALRFEGDLTDLFLFLWSLWLLLLWTITALFWTDYYLDVLLVTIHRVIDIEQRGMFNRRVSTFRYD
ncbi:MAG: Uncharacterized protein Greene041679_228, partial [Parcubacteria group bacterium Greene0416_79]